MFVEKHDTNIIKNTKPYPHVNEILEKLRKNNDLIAIATNKRVKPTMKLINHYGWSKYFKYIECSDSKKKIRGKTEMIEDIIKKNKIFNESFFVGDTISDGLAAYENKIKFIFANYGYGKINEQQNIYIYKNICCIKKLSSLH